MKKPVKNKVYRMIEQGVSDRAIMRRAHISLGSLAAYKAHYSREHRPQLSAGKERTVRPGRLERETGSSRNYTPRSIITSLLDRGADYERVYADPRLRGVSMGTISAYIAHWSRGSYKKKR